MVGPDSLVSQSLQSFKPQTNIHFVLFAQLQVQSPPLCINPQALLTILNELRLPLEALSTMTTVNLSDVLDLDGLLLELAWTALQLSPDDVLEVSCHIHVSDFGVSTPSIFTKYPSSVEQGSHLTILLE